MVIIIVIINNKQKMNFAIPADHKVKSKESEKCDNCLNFPTELKRKNDET